MRWFFAIVFLLVAALPAEAQELRLGYRTEPTSLDPHYHNATPSSQVAMHIFDSLITASGTDRLDPGLAIGWKTVDPTTWEFALRPGVRFGDGTPFTADDVVFSYQRVRTVPTPMGGYVNYLGPVASVEAVDATTLRVHTAQPTPLLPNYLSRIFILSRRIHENAATDAFNSGKALVGTGPYRLANATGMTSLTFERKDDYWGKPPIWKTVTTRVIGNDAARLAALLAGDVDVIETVPTTDAARLAKDPRVTVSSIVSQRVMYFWFDWLNPGPSPNYSDVDGKPLAKNPFLDIRVRQAFSKAIDRAALIDRLMEGFAAPAGQFVHAGQQGYAADIKPDEYDPAAARRLLAEAGFPARFPFDHPWAVRPLEQRWPRRGGGGADAGAHRHHRAGRCLAVCHLCTPRIARRFQFPFIRGGLLDRRARRRAGRYRADAGPDARLGRGQSRPLFQSAARRARR